MNLALTEAALPLRLRLERPMTDEELLRFCADNDPLRMERDANGEIIVMSPNGSEGGSTELNVASDLIVWARSDGRGKAFGPTSGFKMPDSSIRAADAAWVSWSRWNALTPKQQKSYSPLCPEFVIEVRSESDRLPPLHLKMAQWIANGAQLAWLIDPLEQAVTIYRPKEQPEIHHHPTSVQGDGIMTGFELIMARIWV